MNEDDLRTLLWLRAIETEPVPGVPWSPADTAWASQEARRRPGAAAAGDAGLLTQFALDRARLAADRLATRGADWVAPEAPGRTMGPMLVATVLLLAALCGLASDALSGGQRINLLAPPVLLLLAWNLLVYLALLVSALRSKAGPGGGLAGRPWAAALARAMAALYARAVRSAGPTAALRTGWAVDLARCTAAVQAQRAAALLHAAAALFALGMLLGLYGRGLVLDYRVAWDSTFLEPAQVRAWLGLLLGPASAWGGWPLPDAAAVAAMRGAEGGIGTPAAPWIHRYALTVTAVVVLPRAVLAAWSLAASRRLARQLRVPLDDAWLCGLRLHMPPTAHAARPLTVLPYSYTLSAAQRDAVPRTVAHVLAPCGQVHLAATLPMGAEDNVAPHVHAARGADVALLLAASATPERETHGACAMALAAALPQGRALRVLIDLSGYRERLGSVPEAPARLHQRQAAWRQMLADGGAPAPHFIDLLSEPWPGAASGTTTAPSAGPIRADGADRAARPGAAP